MVNNMRMWLSVPSSVVLVAQRAQQLLDSFPVHWSEENDNPIESNQNTLFDETETYEPATSLWELHPDSTNRPQSE